MATNPFALGLGGPQSPLPGLAGEVFNPGATSSFAPDPAAFVAQAPIAPPRPSALDKLRPGSELHDKVRGKLDAMHEFSEQAMKKHYSRWQVTERKVQAFLHSHDYNLLEESTRAGQNFVPPESVSIVVPYTYATLHAAGTYISSVLLGRKPVFPLVATRATKADRARLMETVLQHNLDASHGQEVLWQQIWDSLCYGFSAVPIDWMEKQGNEIGIDAAGNRVQTRALTYAGNRIDICDPYRLFPDPRVAISRAARDGDFLFYRTLVSETELKQREKDHPERYKYIDEALAKARVQSPKSETEQSQSRIRLGQKDLGPRNVVGFQEPLTGTVRLIPKDWGLDSEDDTAQLWRFTWFKNGQIIQAAPLDMVHDQHPMAITEPAAIGHDFMSLSSAELITVFQDLISWLVSSRMENVRASIRATFAVDPARIEVNDIQSSTIGRVIRLKQSAMGLPISEAITQIAVSDVTGGHLSDIQVMRLLADTSTGVNDNMRGIQSQGGRRSATEARISMQAGASRLSQLAIRMSSQSYWPMAMQMISNVQQFIPDQYWIEMSGDGPDAAGLQVDANQLIGSYNFQISDGTLPLDKSAMLEQWKEILMGIMQDPELRQTWSVSEVFRYIAELGGAKNIDSFKKQTPTVLDPGQAPPAGMVPAGPAIPSMPPMM